MNRRRVEKLETKRTKTKPVPDALVERYYQLQENARAELEGRPPPHPNPPNKPYGSGP